MAIRKIVKKGDDILRKKCKPVEVFDEKLGVLLDDMKETLTQASGAGLAGPQVGILRRVAIIYVEDDDCYMEVVNPVILKRSGKNRGIEGCLSCPDEWGYVTRPKKCVIRAQDRNGKFFDKTLTEMAARCACHEVDHLDGKLFIDFVEEFVDMDKE